MFRGLFFFFFGCSCCIGAELFEFSAFLEPILPLQRNEGSAEESAVWKISGLEIRMILSFREKYRFELRENVQMGFWNESFKNSISVLQRHPLLSFESNFVVWGINHKHPARVETWSISVYFWSNQRRVCAWVTFHYIYFECSVSQKNGDVVLCCALHGQV